MILFINLCIHWAKASLDASYWLAKCAGVEPYPEEAQQVANELLTSKEPKDRGQIAWQFQPDFCMNSDGQELEPTEEECYEADRHMARRLGEDGPYNNC